MLKKKYIAILLFLGINPVRNVRLLWKKDYRFTYNEHIAKLMTNTRFKEINAVFDIISRKDYKNDKVLNEPKIMKYLNTQFAQHMSFVKT